MSDCPRDNEQTELVDKMEATVKSFTAQLANDKHDARLLAIARTQVELGFMAMRKSVEGPRR